MNGVITPERKLVASAATALDELYPEWAQWVNPNALYMISEYECVGGQIAHHLNEERTDEDDERYSWYTVATQVYEKAPGVEGGGVFSGYTSYWQEEIAARRGDVTDGE